MLATSLQTALQRFAKRWYRRRALRIFRDDSNLENNEALWGSLAQALDDSANLILLASPASARSPWIPREVRHWRASHAEGRLLVVLTGGEIVRNAAETDYDWERTTALPRDLADQFAGGPRYTDLRWAHEDEEFPLNDRRVIEAVADIAAPLHRTTKDDMISRDAAEHRRTKRTIAAVGTVLAALAVTATVFALLANAARHRAETEARIALARQLAAQSRVALNADRPDLALLLAVRASRTNATAESRDALLAALNAAPQLVRVETTPPARLAAAAANGRSVTLLGRDATLRRVDTATGRLVKSLKIRRTDATGLAASGDGRLVAVGGPRGALAVADLDAGSSKELVAAAPPADTTVSSDDVNHPVFAARRPVLVWDAGQRVGVWTGGDPQALDAPYSPEDVPWKPAVSADGRRVAAVGGEVARVVVWSVGGDGRARGAGRLLPAAAGVEGLGSREVITALAFSPADDGLLAVARSDGAVELVDVDSGQNVRLLHGGRGRVEHIAFAPDGRRLVAAHESGVDTWDVATGRRLPGHASPFSSDLAVGLQPGGRLATAAGSIGTVAAIEVLQARHGLAQPLPGIDGTADAVLASPDGRSVLASYWSGPTQLLDGTSAQTLPIRNADTFLHFSQDGRHLLACCGPGFDSVLRVTGTDGRVAERFEAHSGSFIADAALTSSGQLLVLGSGDQGAVVWDPRHPKGARRLAGEPKGEPAKLSPDGRWAALVAADRTAVWSTRDGRRRGPFVAGRPIAFSPDGRRLVVTTEDATGGTIRVVGAGNGAPAGAAIETQEPVAAAAFSPSGRTLALVTKSASLTEPATYVVELWDPARAKKVGDEPLVTWTAPERSTLTPSVTFHARRSGPPGVVIGGLARQPLEWTLDLADWRRAACGIVGRDFTRAEWDRYVGNVASYEPTCPRD